MSLFSWERGVDRLATLHTHLGQHTHTRSKMWNAQNRIFFFQKWCLQEASGPSCFCADLQSCCMWFLARAPVLDSSPPPACVFVCMGRVSCTRIAFLWDQKSCLNLKLNESETLAEACCIAPGDKQIFSPLYIFRISARRRWALGELSDHIFEQLTIVFTGVSLHASNANSFNTTLDFSQL